MGAVTGMLGLGGGAAGTGLQGAQQANIVNPVTSQQLTQANTGAINSLDAQTQLLQALQQQNGLQNQTNVYNQLQGVANGTGPNPAQAQLAQATGQNVANQAALMAGQRGAAGNVGLMARQAAQTGSGIQQNAAGQAATLQANQSLAALNNLGGMANTMATNQIGQTNANTSARQAQQQGLLQAQGAYNNAQVGSQTSVNNANAQLASGRAGNQAGAIGGLLNAAGPALQGIGGLFGSSAPAGTLMAGGAGDAIGGAATLPAEIGAVAPMLAAEGGDVEAQSSQTPYAGQSKFGAFLAGQGATTSAGMFAHGGSVPAMLSPGEKYLSPKDVEEVKRGKNPMQVGKTVPGKPKVDGAKDSYANDIVPAKLEEGGIVVPRSKTQSKNPQDASAKFVETVLARRAAKGKK